MNYMIRYAILCIFILSSFDQAGSFIPRSYVRWISKSNTRPSLIPIPTRVLRLASSSLNDQTNDFKTIFVLPRVEIPIQSGIGFIQEFAMESINSLGAGMKATVGNQLIP
jgi:hypothetical protein